MVIDMAIKWLSESEFRKSPSTDAALRKSFTAEVKSEDGKPIRFCISTATPDRMGDVIAVEGWKLDSYQKNPVVLWAHDRRSPPVAKATRVWTEQDKLLMEMEFTNRELYPFGAMVGDMVRGGFLNASSVGFRPIKYAYNEERGSYAMDFIEAELLENSIVPVPANPEALVEAKAAGIELAPLVEWLDRSLDCATEAGLILPRAALEKAWKAAGDERVIVVGKAPVPASTADRLEAACARMEAACERVETAAVRVENAMSEPEEPEGEPVPEVPGDEGRAASGAELLSVFLNSRQ
jgi:HK97 family phage prohead protease